ncbi:phosphatidylglycerophosphate synthase [Pseudorhizobium tarimense]|uniref:Phosphatidylglycerophosphate synthase n=1 Tax=Pseudorhizobium tarimense TaxID=1079109 RepID=A0ABV2H8Z4_9HYPH|nr:CDP-alcohol phosphatidyltransferase family protein [Pseudorhizobium tarimense]MCJ8520078.1 CDP-alcohol phosphatidyltransferase family protein [Pseudorhizobium tarimense]
MAEHLGLSRLNLPRDRPHSDGGAPLALYAQAAIAFLFGATLIAVLVHALETMLGNVGNAIWYALFIYAGISIFAFAKLPTHAHPRYGPANVVTTFRAAATAAIGGLILGSGGFSDPAAEHLHWAVAGCAAVALALDGIDGYLARRSGTSSRFGARFDMETDALLILLLAAGAALLGKAGAWVLLIGLMRYAFIGAQWALTRISGDLPESMRRKAICVSQGVALCAALVPAITPPFAGIILALALLSLLFSFAVDIVYLWRTGGTTSHVA